MIWILNDPLRMSDIISRLPRLGVPVFERKLLLRRGLSCEGSMLRLTNLNLRRSSRGKWSRN
jgi:hypothetical protein